MKSLKWIAVLGLTAWAGAAAAQDCPKDLETVASGKLTVAVTTFAPYSFMDAQNNLSGIDGDIVHALAKDMCLEVEPLVVDPAAAIQDATGLPIYDFNTLIRYLRDGVRQRSYEGYL